MGWTETYYHKKLSHKERREEMDAMFTWESDSAVFSVARSTIKNNVYYAAVKEQYKDGRDGEVWAVICLLSERREGFGYWYGYKDMDETMGPGYYDCPMVILNLLTPTDNEYALAWRENCRKKAAKPNLSRLPEGTTIEFICPYDTTAYKKGDSVSLTKRVARWSVGGGRRTYRWSDGYWYWKQNTIPSDFKIVS